MYRANVTVENVETMLKKKKKYFPILTCTRVNAKLNKLSLRAFVLFIYSTLRAKSSKERKNDHENSLVPKNHLDS